MLDKKYVLNHNIKNIALIRTVLNRIFTVKKYPTYKSL